ncbi:hypothetical protein GCM10027284_46760 [Cyclobacterium sediminis]
MIYWLSGNLGISDFVICDVVMSGAKHLDSITFGLEWLSKHWEASANSRTFTFEKYMPSNEIIEIYSLTPPQKKFNN